MAWSGYQIFLAVLLVFTGTINTITTKWADHLEAKGRDGKVRPFNHSFVQACCMFFGEMLCLIVFKILYFHYARRMDDSLDTNNLVKGSQEFHPLLLFPASMCDMIGTSLMYIGLNLTSPSSFQMLRGSVIVFVAVLSTIFLRRRIGLMKWAGIVLVVVGLVIVGVSDFLLSSDMPDSSKMIMGDVLIVGAQVITATQMVYEEKFISTKDIPPLQAVGWEGVWGFLVLSILLVPFYYIKVPEPFQENSNGSLEDFLEAMIQCVNNPLLIVSLTGTIISIAFFNFAGVSVTKEMSATTRMILDSVRTVFIWGFSLLVRWQLFHPLQILGFVFLVLGTAIYNELIPLKRFFCCNQRQDEQLITNQETGDQ